MKNLIQYTAWVYVPDSENQENFDVEGLVEVTYETEEVLKAKVTRHIADKNRCEFNHVTHLEIEKIESI